MFKTPVQILTSDQANIHFLSYSNALIGSAATAKKRIWVLAYVIFANLSLKADPVTLFLSTLKKRKASGCDIRFIIDNPQTNRPNYHCNKFIMRYLEECEFRFCSPRKGVTSHAKAVLIDDKVLFIGSHNLAKSSLTNPLDCTVELRNKFLIQSFAEAYLMFWENEGLIKWKPGDHPPERYYG